MPPQPDCDLFCRVIDNYGDIGVCWRLAKQLRNEHGWQVRLWVDDLAACTQLTPTTIPDGIEIEHWTHEFPAITPAAVVIEAFACELPESYLDAMARMPSKPVWINLEYLCVEDWGPGFHCQPSPHPRLPLTKYFFVPGILPGTGGLLREYDLLERRNRFDVETARHTYSDGTDATGLWVFLFCYDNPALPLLLDVWATGRQTMHCLVSAGKASVQASQWAGQTLEPGQHLHYGNLHLHTLPFVEQQNFDHLLWMCDLNFVRGEDSFCRAQWAAKPLVWQIYPQQDAAHHAKLESFYNHYGLTGKAGAALSNFSANWNGISPATQKSLALAWQALADELPALSAHAEEWLQRLNAQENLATNLVRFCRKTAL